MDFILKNYNPILNNYDLDIDIEKYTGNQALVGAVPKYYVKLDKDTKKIVEANAKDFEYILKFSDDWFDSDSANEHFFLWLSNKCNINTSSAEIIESKNSFDELDYMLLSKRFTSDKSLIVPFYELLSTSKEEEGVSLEDLYNTIANLELSEDKIENIKQELFKQILYSNTIGNYDLHLGNLSFLTNEHKQIIDLAPAYDVLCTYIQIYGDGTKSAIKINDKNKDVEASDIIEVSAKYINIDILKDIVKNLYRNLKDNFPEIKNSYIDKYAQEEAINYISERINILGNCIDSYIDISKELSKATISTVSSIDNYSIVKEFNINDLKELNSNMLKKIANQELEEQKDLNQEKSNDNKKEIQENKNFGINL